MISSTSHHSTQSTDTLVIGDENNDTASADFVTASDYSKSEESNIERLVEHQVEKDSTKTRLKEELLLNFYLSKECLEAKETVEKVLEKNIKLENDLVRVNKEAKEMEIKCQEEIEKLRRQEAARNKDMAKLNEYVRLLERRVEMFSRIAQASVQMNIKEESLELEQNLPTSPAKRRRHGFIVDNGNNDQNEKEEAEKSIKCDLHVTNKRANTSLQIVEHRLENKSIRLVNTSNEPIDLGNWCFVSCLNGNEAILHKFHPATRIGPNAEMLLWSEWSHHAKHYPPHDFIMSKNYRRDYGEVFVWDMLNEWDVVSDVLRCPNGQEQARTEFMLSFGQV